MTIPRLYYYSACKVAVNNALNWRDAGYIVSKYRFTWETANKIARRNGDMRNNVNAYTYTTLGAGQLCENRFMVVMVKLHPGYEEARLDENALDNALINALKQAAKSKTDLHILTYEYESYMYTLRFKIGEDEI